MRAPLRKLDRAPAHAQVMVAFMQEAPSVSAPRITGATSLASALDLPSPSPLRSTLSALQAAHIARVPASPWDGDREGDTAPADSASSLAAEARPPSDHTLLHSTASTDNTAGRNVRTVSCDPLEIRRSASMPEPELG